MPASVVSVSRKRSRLEAGGRLHLPSVFRAFSVVAMRLLAGAREARREARALARSSWQARMHADARAHRPPAFRGMPVLVADASGEALCVGCELCAQVCPTHCIDVVPGTAESAGADRAAVVERFDLDLSRCLFCGRCEEVCAERAVVMSPLVEVAARSREDLRFDKEALLVPAEAVGRRLSYLEATRGSASSGQAIS